VGRQDRIQRAVGCLSRALLAGTSAPARASQFKVAESGSKAQRVIALDGTQSMATRARPVVMEVFCQLLPDQLLLQAMQYCLGFVQSQAYVLDVLTRAVKSVNRHPIMTSIPDAVLSESVVCDAGRRPTGAPVHNQR